MKRSRRLPSLDPSLAGVLIESYLVVDLIESYPGLRVPWRCEGAPV